MAALCIDWGNSLVKAALVSPDMSISSLQTFGHADAEAGIQKMLAGSAPAGAVLSAVTAVPAPVMELLGTLPHFMQVSAATRVPVINAYHSSGTLGADRMAAAVAANYLFPDKNNLVISLGTCLTFNFIMKNRTFRGGSISPGLRMRLQAMHHFTGALPQVEPEGHLLLLGYDTESCMRSGAAYGMAMEIRGIMNEYAGQWEDFNPILTGGDVPFFARHFKMGIFADPALPLKGLYLILRHNVPQIA
jgi:type III pantothenate kinase